MKTTTVPDEDFTIALLQDVWPNKKMIQLLLQVSIVAKYLFFLKVWIVKLTKNCLILC